MKSLSLQLFTKVIVITYRLIESAELTANTCNNHSFVDNFIFESCYPFKNSSPLLYWSWGFCINYTALYRIASKDGWKMTDSLCHLGKDLCCKTNGTIITAFHVIASGPQNTMSHETVQ